ncbi:SWIB-domain-containing protein [Canariomyces notabilis]|uniref:SWIB-domain-containing protein n=1 Tax=Canariomyces notabilis TaxID=2074819 RepID=A0AAN6TDD1_9PEZI|nr:SWIB-domain-containing protein [Canariomyces arenarius]
MSAPLTDQERETYTHIIDSILASADLQTVTRKKIRQGLEEAIDKDLSEQKTAIKSLIEARFDAISAEAAQGIPTPTSGAGVEPSPKHVVNGRSPSNDADDTGADGEIEVSLPPAKKKQKRESSSEDADARLAAELQAQENRLSRGRVTRGAGSTKAKAKPKAKKKSAKRVRSDDESEAGDSETGSKPKRKSGGGFQKPFNLSLPLAELCGEERLSRPQVVKKLWDYIKANELQDPNDKRQIMCDEKLQAVFKQDKINMFSMNKALGNQLYPIED